MNTSQSLDLSGYARAPTSAWNIVIPAKEGIQRSQGPAADPLDLRFPHGTSPWADGARGDG
jgi:hypothetical protein